MTSPLALELLDWVARMSRRADVHVQQQHSSWGASLGKWESVLPPDMYEFYKTLNGFGFFYTLEGDKDDSWNGFKLLGLEQGKHNVIDPQYRRYAIPYQKASRYPEYFFHDDSDIDPTDDVLFFMGEDSGWGVLMTKSEQGHVSFYKWDNDGFTDYLGDSFTDVIRQGLANQFAHTWAYDKHHETDKVLELLSQEVPEHHTFDVVVEAFEQLDGMAWRQRYASDAWVKMFDRLMQAVGREETVEHTTPEQREEIVEVVLGPDGKLNAKQAKEVMSLLTSERKKTKKAMAAYFHHDNALCWAVRLHITHVGGPLPLLEAYGETALRVCASVPELAAMFQHSALAPSVYASTRPASVGYERHAHGFVSMNFAQWTPLEALIEDTRHPQHTYTLDVVIKNDLPGVQVGDVYASTALPTVMQAFPS